MLFSIIILGLKDLLKQREENFREHIEKRKKKIETAMLRIFHPFTLLTLAYVGFLIYHTHLLLEKSNDPNISLLNRDSLITQHIVTIVVVLLLVIIDVYLKI